MMVRVLFFLFWLLPAPVWAGPPEAICSPPARGHIDCIRKSHFVYDTCNTIERAARRYGLNPHFFARLIWQESRFDPNALSPAGAQGIAQFMPHTARRRGLADPYNPAEALDRSAEYLAEMARRYGNLGLAAVGYNGGERRAEGLIAGTGGLARETVDFVRIITGVPHQNWLQEPQPAPDLRLSPALPFQPACHDLAKNRRMTALTPVAPAIKPWGIQMAFGTSKARARAKYAEITRPCAAQLKQEVPDLIWQKSRASPSGGYYLVRLGRETRDGAWRSCVKLKKAGCICAVYANSD